MENNLNELDNESIMSSINIDDDDLINLENGKNQETNISTPLRGILKKSCEYSEEHQLFYSKAIKICKISALFIVNTPILFCDIYYGFSNTNCVNTNPNNLDISLKLYLLLSGFMGIILLLLASIIIIFMDFKLSEYCDKKLTRINELELIRIKEFIESIKNLCKHIISVFNLIWNIVGSVVFWAHYYENGLCNIYISTYLFISILIKLLASIIYLCRKL